MTWSLTDIYRHPVKSLGEEALETVILEAGKPMPHDRMIAIAHGSSEWAADTPGWIGGSRNVVNQTQVPRLAQIKTSYEPASGRLSLSHPDLGDLTVTPGSQADDDKLMDWVAPLTEGTPSTGPFQICRAPGVAYTDFEDTHISIATGNSLRALEERVGKQLEHIRFRMNLWLEGPPAWSDLDWVGREVEIGEVRLKVIGRDARCNATNANPATGGRDTQIPALLRKDLGHMDFGVYAQVVRGGVIKRGNEARLV